MWQDQAFLVEEVQALTDATAVVLLTRVVKRTVAAAQVREGLEPFGIPVLDTEVPNPSDSYSMFGELGAIIDHVAQVCDQLASWHNRVDDGTHYEGEDGGTEGSAHSYNAIVRWYPGRVDEG